MYRRSMGIIKYNHKKTEFKKRGEASSVFPSFFQSLDLSVYFTGLLVSERVRGWFYFFHEGAQSLFLQAQREKGFLSAYLSSKNGCDAVLFVLEQE